MKYVAFLKPIKNWDDLDWIYNLMEDKTENRDFFLVEAKTPKQARELVANELYFSTDKDGVVLTSFNRFCVLDYENDELLTFFDEKDSKTAIEFYEKYTYEAFYNGKISFFDEFEKEDRDLFYNFDEENLKKLYIQERWYDILVMPITKDLSNKR